MKKQNLILTLLAAQMLSLSAMAEKSAQVQDQELDPNRATQLFLRANPKYQEASPAEIEAELRTQGIFDDDASNVVIEKNMPVGVFPIGESDVVLVKVHRDSLPQYAEIFLNGEFVQSYWVSTGSAGTPAKTRNVYEASWNRVSRTYNNSQMTGALMYDGGYGVHMTGYKNELGRRASKGCVRMEDAGVYKIWKLMEGSRVVKSTRINDQGKTVSVTQLLPNSQVVIQVLAGKHAGRPPRGLAPYQGGQLQRIDKDDLSARPANGRVTAN